MLSDRPRFPAVVIVEDGNPKLSSDAVAAALDPGGPLVDPGGGTVGTRLRYLAHLATVLADEARRHVYEDGNAASPLGEVDLLGQALRAALAILPGSTAAFHGQPWRYPEHVARSLARAIAIAVHLRLHLAFHAGLTNGAAEPTGAPEPSLAEAWAWYRDTLLRRSRQACLEPEPAGFAPLAGEALGRSVELAHLCEDVARRSRQALATDGLRASMLARRVSMGAAALVLLDWRARQRNRVKGLRDRAAACVRLARVSSLSTASPTRLPDGRVGATWSLLGRVRRIQFAETAQPPFSIATLDPGPAEIFLPHRNLRRVGVAVGGTLFARGKVKAFGEKAIARLEVAFEGPGSSERLYWEDRLAVLARPAYDLHPGTLALDWELPRLGSRGSASELLSRLR